MRTENVCGFIWSPYIYIYIYIYMPYLAIDLGYVLTHIFLTFDVVFRFCLTTVELGYNNFDLCDTSDIALYILWFQLISQKARVFLPWLVRHT